MNQATLAGDRHLGGAGRGGLGFWGFASLVVLEMVCRRKIGGLTTQVILHPSAEPLMRGTNGIIRRRSKYGLARQRANLPKYAGWRGLLETRQLKNVTLFSRFYVRKLLIRALSRNLKSFLADPDGC